MVPVLSSTTTSTFFICSRAVASLMRICSRATLPIPTIRAVGVARPSAQGHAITSTDTAESIALANSPAPPANSQTTIVRSEIPATTGTNTEAILSAMRCTGALLPWASRTVFIICPSRDSPPIFSAVKSKVPFWLIVPASTL
ncbi:hypothetical protein SDC9_113542 [bioreactor metagenome]|uniref:Uncharacterized protein n=1 Tax=bioreactor metagenome TaxID=1076179 RepID=A0A645BN84_9ZZZZ